MRFAIDPSHLRLSWLNSRARLAAVALTALLALAGAGSLAASAQAATYTVGTTEDTAGNCENPETEICSLRQLITHENNLAATPNPPDKIVVPANSYFLANGPLTIFRSVSIVGAGARAVSIFQNSTPATRVFVVEPNPRTGVVPTVTISGVTIGIRPRQRQQRILRWRCPQQGNAHAERRRNHTRHCRIRLRRRHFQRRGHIDLDALARDHQRKHQSQWRAATRVRSRTSAPTPSRARPASWLSKTRRSPTTPPPWAAGSSAGVTKAGAPPTARTRATPPRSSTRRSRTTTVAPAALKAVACWPVRARSRSRTRSSRATPSRNRSRERSSPRTVEPAASPRLATTSRAQPTVASRPPATSRTPIRSSCRADCRTTAATRTRSPCRRPVPRSTRSLPTQRDATPLISGASRDRRAPAATSARTSCSSRSRGSSSPRWLALPECRKEPRLRSTGETVRIPRRPRSTPPPGSSPAPIPTPRRASTTRASLIRTVTAALKPAPSMSRSRTPR